MKDMLNLPSRLLGLRDRFFPGKRQPPPSATSFQFKKLGTLAEYTGYAHSMRKEYDRRKNVELALIPENAERFVVPGYCVACAQQFPLHVDFAYCFTNPDGTCLPNWRERLVCPGCGLNNRMRASIHFFQDHLNPAQDCSLFLTEQTTPLFSWFEKHFANTVGSEYLGHAFNPGEHDQNGIRHEDLACLSFEDGRFDAVLSFDVFEHIPDYRKAFQECRRVLKPGGVLFSTIPFDLKAQAHTVRARITSDGTLEHYLPPEYHGNPLSSDGCLCFRHFGWDCLNELRAAGFMEASLYFYWSLECGYLGGEQFLILATA